MPKSYSAEILDTLEAFLDTNPNLPLDADVEFEEREEGEYTGVLMEKVTVGGVEHLIVVKVVG